nr:MAG TPA: LytB-sulfur-cluster binding, oxidoreductase [Caudoviricetes sp.]
MFTFLCNFYIRAFTILLFKLFYCFFFLLFFI